MINISACYHHVFPIMVAEYTVIDVYRKGWPFKGYHFRLRYTPEKVERELLPRIMQGLADGTIDKDEFEKDLKERKL